MALIERAMPLGGGAGLNFSIVGSTEEPNNPKENTIWITTDTAIGEWQFSATQPTARADGTALQNGDIWIETSTLKQSIVINALKKNGIHLYCTSARQYIDTIWVEKETYVYQDADWANIDCVIWIIDDIGKIAYANFTISGQATMPYVSNEALMFYMSTPGETWGYGYWVCSEPIDVTNYSLITFDYNQLKAANASGLPTERYFYVGLYTTNSANGSFTVNKQFTASSSAASGTATIDVSNLSGIYYLKVYAHSFGNKGNTTTMYLGINNLKIVP